MANQIVVYCATPAPQTIAYSFSATGTGANWDPTKYYAVHVTACYDPNDENIWLTGVLNYGINHNMSDTYTMEELQAAVSPANADDALTVTWTAPPGPPPHHYNVHIQGPNATNDIYAIGDYGSPMNDALEIGNDTFTFTILDPTDTQGSLVTSVMLEVDEDDDYIIIEGNHLMQAGNLTPMTGDAAGANQSLTVAHADLVYDCRGTLTKIYFNEELAGLAAGELLTYRDLRHTFLSATGNYWAYSGALSTSYGIALSPVLQVIPQMRSKMIRDHNGYLVPRARILDAPVQYLDVTVCSISATYAEWQLLMEYLKSGSRLWVIDVNTSYTDGNHYPFPMYLCRLVDTNYVGSIGKNARDRYMLHFEVEEQKAMIAVT